MKSNLWHIAHGRKIVLTFTPLTTKRREKKEKQVYEFIEITGKALEKKLIAEYIKNLQEISYYKMTFLQKSQQTIRSGYPIYSFTAYSYMPEDKKEK